MTDASPIPVYQLKIVLKGISPMIWRRLQVSGACSMEDLHHILQIAMGWSDECLNRFKIHGKEYGVYHPGSLCFSDEASDVQLADLQLREREKFLYEYDLIDGWQHEIRVEALDYPESPPDHPVCLAGKRSAPPEGCGGVWAFQEKRQDYDLAAAELIAEIAAGGAEVVLERAQEICQVHDWLNLKNFDRAEVNRRLKRYCKGDPPELGEANRRWMYAEEFADAGQSSTGS